MVKSKSNIWIKTAEMFFIILAVLAFFIGAFTGMFIVVLVSVAVGYGAYYLGMNADVEYEYLYCDKEISVDKILNKSRRKHVATYSLDKIEIMAPLKSYHLDGYKNRTFKNNFDYSSKVENQPERRYVFFYEGNTKVVFEPDARMVNVIHNISPRKFYTD